MSAGHKYIILQIYYCTIDVLYDLVTYVQGEMNEY